MYPILTVSPTRSVPASGFSWPTTMRARAVRSDDADDSAGGQLERHIIDQQLVAVRFADGIRFNDHRSQTRTGRDVDLQLLNLLLRLLIQKRLVRVDARFSFRVTPFGRHANPFQ